MSKLCIKDLKMDLYGQVRQQSLVRFPSCLLGQKPQVQCKLDLQTCRILCGCVICIVVLHYNWIIFTHCFNCRNLTSYQAKTSTTSLEIVLDGARKIYTTGSEVTGQVVITATEQVNFDQIIVSRKGEGRVYPSHYGKILKWWPLPAYVVTVHVFEFCYKQCAVSRL